VPGKKLLVIGLDGADYYLTNMLISRGIWKFLGSSNVGLLKTVIPPKTPNAWISSATGLNPGRHGIFDIFLNVDLKKKKLEYASTSKARAKFVWDYLIERDVNVAVVNFPFMYPVPSISDGVFVGGMGTPSGSQDFTSPRSLARELLEQEYIVDVGDNALEMMSMVKHEPEKYLTLLGRMLVSRARAVEYILNNFEVDFLFVVIVALDRILHWFYPDVYAILSDRKDFSSLSRRELELLRILRLIDRTVERIYASFSKSSRAKVPVLIYSDHGFKAVRRALLMNSILIRLKLAKPEEKESPLSQALVLSVASRLKATNMLNYLPSSLIRTVGWRMSPSSHFSEVFSLNEEETQAFYFSNYIWNNDSSRGAGAEPPEVKKKITRLGDILEKHGVVIVPSRYVFKGPFTARIPPYIVATRHDNDLMALSLFPKTSTYSILSLEEINDPIPSLYWRGDHTINATVLVNRARLAGERIDIFDITPSILKYYGIHTPVHMDGKASIAFEG